MKIRAGGINTRIDLFKIMKLFKDFVSDLWGSGREVLVWKVDADFGRPTELFFVVVGSPPLMYAKFDFNKQTLSMSKTLEGEWFTIAATLDFDEEHLSLLGTTSVLAESLSVREVQEYKSRGYNVVDLVKLRMMEDI